MLRQKFSGAGEVQSIVKGVGSLFVRGFKMVLWRKMHLRWFLEDGKNFYQRGTCISNKGRAWVLETDECIAREAFP